MEITAICTVAGFLFGALLTAISFVFKFSNQIAVMQRTLDSLSESFQNHIDAKVPVCPAHESMVTGAALREERLKEACRELLEIKGLLTKVRHD